MSDISATIGRMWEGSRVAGLQWRVILLCALVMVLDGFDKVTIGYLIPYIARDWGSSMGAVTIMAGIGGPIFAGVLMSSGMSITWVFVWCAAPLALGAVAIFALRGVRAESSAEPAAAPAQ